MQDKRKITQEEFDDLVKSLDSLKNDGLIGQTVYDEAIEKAKKDMTAEEDDDMTKAYHAKMDEMKKAYDMKMDEMKKAYDMKMDEMKKAIEDMRGKLPGSPATATTNLGKSEKNEIGTKETENNQDLLIKSVQDTMSSVVEPINKSIEDLSNRVNQIAEAPNPLKSILGNYATINKAVGENDKGQKVFSLGVHNAQIKDELLKAFDKAEGAEKNTLANAVQTLEAKGVLTTDGENIVKSIQNIDIEK